MSVSGVAVELVSAGAYRAVTQRVGKADSELTGVVST